MTTKVMANLDDKADKNVKRIQSTLDIENDIKLTKPEILNAIVRTADLENTIEEIIGDFSE